ncbi:DUF4870 domain-containing protein [Flavobacterium nackdongense]|uniref:DUF4870 domain-containing protein n=1 Tax=Flavobacterium nackdongense TaxID=2547394 RepID=A0A4P6YGF5_9FLAO|nr:DUF4870 domain-containing protein [Flavobacterium nackdongense]QBN19897.1 DUF4870 domain-containing protein [Flavobacterium nackdongense]
METTNNKNLATFTHLSTLSQYCIPFGNYIFPLLIWSTNRDKSEFIDYNGKQALNFQLSIFLYSLVLAMIAIPIILITIFNNVPLETVINDGDFMENHLSVENITGIVIVAIIAILLFVGMKVAEFFLIIYASVKTSNGEKYNYPLTIPFLK